MEINEITTPEELERLYKGSALTFTGLYPDEENLSQMLGWIENYTPLKRERVFVVKGATMNRVYGLTQENAYLDDLNIVCVSLEDMENPMAIALPRFSIGGRWFDDVVDNDARRQQEIDAV